MVAYSFNKRFAEPIAIGHPTTGIVKRQTVRADRTRHARPGELLQLYQGMRTKHCQKIIADPVCVAVEPVRMALAGTCYVHFLGRDQFFHVPRQLDDFARRDGFLHWPELQAFWHAAHPESADPDARFTGVVVCSEPAR